MSDKKRIQKLACLYNASDLLALEYIQEKELLKSKEDLQEYSELCSMNEILNFSTGHLNDEDGYHQRLRTLLSKLGVKFNKYGEALEE